MNSQIPEPRKGPSSEFQIPEQTNSVHDDILQLLLTGQAHESSIYGMTANEIVICLQADHTIGSVHEAIYQLATDSQIDFPASQDAESRGKVLDAARNLLEKAGFISRRQPWIELVPEPSTQELLSSLTPDAIPRMWRLTDRGREHVLNINQNKVRQEQEAEQEQSMKNPVQDQEDPERFDGLS